MSVTTGPSSRRFRSAGQTTAEWIVIAGVVVAILIGLATVFRVQVATAFTILGTKIMCGVSGGANCTPAGTQTAGGAGGTAGGASTNPTTGLVTTTGASGAGGTAGTAAGLSGSPFVVVGHPNFFQGPYNWGHFGIGPLLNAHYNVERWTRWGATYPLPPGAEPVSTGLGGPLDTLINTSPEFNQLVSQLQQEGYTFVTGRPGGGSYCDKTTKIVTIDANDTTGNNLGDLAGVIAHELGHAGYTKDPYVPYDGLTRGQYIQANLDRHLKDEGEATIKSFEMRDSVAANGGTPPLEIRGVKAADYERIYNQYLADGDREKAQFEIGRLIGQFETTSNSGDTYNDYYSEYYEKRWDRNHPGGTP